MGKYKLFQDRLFIYIFSLYLVGLIFGIFTIRGRFNQIIFLKTNFLSVFCANYWYIFLMWLFGFSIVGLFFNSIIIFFRAFLFGAIIAILLPNDLKRLASLFLLEIIIFIPSFFTLAYFSLGLSWSCLGNLINQYHTFNPKKYLNLIVIETIIVIVYSILIIAY